MTTLVPIMLFGWVPLTIILFYIMPSRTAVLCSVIGGTLFLPMASYDLPGIPIYKKETAIALGLILGGILSGKRNQEPFRWCAYDLPMALWCFFCPIATSLSNGLGLYDGLSGVLETYLSWGVFYWAGRIYFNECSSLRDLSWGIIFGGLIYVPLCLYELRMSPQLSNIFYGFFPHKWGQHVRYGGYRPIVFMQHGLMVALWMAQSFIVSFWLWRNKSITHLQGIPMAFFVLFLFIITIFCKSANGWFFLFMGCVCYYYYNIFKSVRLLQVLLLLIPLYIITRITHFLSYETIESIALLFFDEDRVQSLLVRVNQEHLFSAKALMRPFFGWGGWNRGWPVDPETGRTLVHAVDALWTIIFSTRGFIGITSLYSAMLLGPYYILRRYDKRGDMISIENNSFYIDAIALSLVAIVFMTDSLANGMTNPVYILCSGALVSFYLALKEDYS